MKMNIDKYVEKLQQHGALFDYSDGELEVLLDCCEPRDYSVSSAVWSPGAKRTHAYILVSGTLEKTLAVRERKSELIKTPGVILSISSLVHDWPYHSSLVARTNVEVLLLSRARFQAIFDEGEPAAYRIVDQIAEYLVYDVRQANERLQEVFGRPEETLRMLRRRSRTESKA